MRRREFIKRTAGTAAAAALAAVGLKAHEKNPAIKYMQRWFNEQTRGKGGRMPRRIELGQELWDQYLYEVPVGLNLVPTSGKTVHFKTCRAFKGGPGWYLKRLA